jgi:hypothetical protein
MVTKVFLPLRSNTAWFSDEEALRRFERLLRMHIALYDRIVLEDGIFRMNADSGGQGFAFMIPPLSTDADRTRLSFCEPGGAFGISVGGTTVLHGQSSFGCNADFKPVLHRAGLEDATYFEWKSGELIPELKRQTEELAEVDYRDPELEDLLPPQSFLRKELLKGFYRDAVLAHVLRMPFGVDHHLAGFLNYKRRHHPEGNLPAISNVLFDHWLGLELPDFSSYSWQEVHELHETDVGNDLRRMVERVCTSVSNAVPDNPTEDDVRDLVQQAFSQELLSELRAQRTGVGKTTINLVLNFVPYGSVLSTMLEASSFVSQRTSWISLL